MSTLDPTTRLVAIALARFGYERARTSLHPDYNSLEPSAIQALCRQQIPAATHLVRTVPNLEARKVAVSLAQYNYEAARDSNHPAFDVLEKPAMQALCRLALPAAEAVAEYVAQAAPAPAPAEATPAEATPAEAAPAEAAPAAVHEPFGMWHYEFPGSAATPISLCRACSTDAVYEAAQRGETYETWPDGSVLYPCAYAGQSATSA